MIRVGLFLYLIVATAAGPGMCCCFADGFGSLLTKGKSTKSCCPKHDHSQKQAPAKSPSAPCPCQEDRVSPNPAWTVERSDVFGAVSFLLVSMQALPPSQLLMADYSTTSPRNFAFTCLSSKDILRAVHVLRC
ncbi:MAG: hypothetical protein HYX68_14895 [Planctomycetes bacterium]|nr:hypothetical protein [Planctomycetota bacterium]